MISNTASLLVTIAFLAGFAGCKGKATESSGPATDPAEAEVACTTDDDCDGTLTCMGGACVDTSSKAIYTDPSNAVTPDKVQREVQQRTQQAVDRADEALNVE